MLFFYNYFLVISENDSLSKPLYLEKIKGKSKFEKHRKFTIWLHEVKDVILVTLVHTMVFHLIFPNKEMQ